jgi:uncharacterized protein (TIGR02594 family)
MTANQRLYRHARTFIGLAEVAGPKSNPRIQQMIARAASWLDKDDSKTAWCGCAMGDWCFACGLAVPKEYYRAINWLNWGVAVDLEDAKQGDVVVLSRPGGNHVALLDAVVAPRTWALLGGNQSNMVNVSRYPVSLVRGVRRAA